MLDDNNRKKRIPLSLRTPQELEKIPKLSYEDYEYFITHRRPDTIPDDVKGRLDSEDVRILEEIILNAFDTDLSVHGKRDKAYYDSIYKKALGLKSEEAVLCALKYLNDSFLYTSDYTTDLYVMLISKKLVKPENIIKAIKANSITKFLADYDEIKHNDGYVSEDELMMLYHLTPIYNRTQFMKKIHEILRKLNAERDCK